MKNNIVRVVSCLVIGLGLFSCGNPPATYSNGAILISIAVTPLSPSIATGVNRQFTAIGTYSDNSTQDISNSVTWTSSDTSKASISYAGAATAVAAGTTTIKAMLGSISASTTLMITAQNVTLVSIAVTPANPSIARETTQQFMATGTYSDNTTRDITNSVTWSSSSATVATISITAGSRGLALAKSVGATTIAATAGTLSDSAALNVTSATLVGVAVIPANAIITHGTTRQFTATGTYDNGTVQDITDTVIWSSSSAAVATISNAAGFNGLATSVAEGSTTITATSSLTTGARTDSTTLTVVSIAGIVTTFTGTAGAPGFTDGIGVAARFNSPRGIATSGMNLYVSDTSNHTIRKIVIATGQVITFAGTAGYSGFANGTGAAARFNNPQGIATDGTNLYVADSGNSTIRKIVIATGQVTTLAGTAGSSGSTDGTGAGALFNGPLGIIRDGTNLYVADSGNSAIRKIVIATGQVNTFAGAAGAPGFTDSTGAAARFNNPQGIATDGTNLYVADTANHTIRKIVIATGQVTTVAGIAGSSGSTDGIGAGALFNGPSAIIRDGTNLYVADTANHTIRKIVIATGQVTTVAGTAGSSGSTDGTGAAARFNDPAGITRDGANLYVADSSNNTIRRLQ